MAATHCCRYKTPSSLKVSAWEAAAAEAKSTCGQVQTRSPPPRSNLPARTTTVQRIMGEYWLLTYVGGIAYYGMLQWNVTNLNCT